MMQITRLTIILFMLSLLSPMVGCGIDTNPFPNSSDGTLSSPGDDMSETGAGDADPGADQTNNGDAGGADSTEPESTTCDMGEQGRTPYTIFHASSRTLLVGDVESVQSQSTVQIQDSAGSDITQTQSAEDGSFALQHDAPLPDTIKVRSGMADTGTSEIQVGLTDATTAAYTSSQQIVDAWLESDFADDSGFTLVQAGDIIEVEATSQTLLPGLSVVLANLSQGMAMVQKVTGEGSVSVWVQADSGDRIVVFTVEHGSSNGGGQPLILEAP